MSSFTINRVVLIGRLTRDPELRALPSGTRVCTLRIACNSSHKDADGVYCQRPNYFNVCVYGTAAESASHYTKKGSRVGVDGQLKWREWETAERTKRQAVDIVADTIQFLDGLSDRAELDAPSDGDEVESVDTGFEEDDPDYVSPPPHGLGRK